MQAVWNIAWNYKGLDTTVRLLKKIGHPEADKYEAELNDYKQTFVKAYRDHAAKAPIWTDDAGRERHLAPTAFTGTEQPSHPFYLDTGPLVAVYAGLLDANDPLIQDSLAFYREGPHAKTYDPRGHMHQRPVLVHEISSCEPCYSFNIVCSWQSGDREKFLQGVYSLLSGGISQQTFSGCEHRHGIWSLPAPGALMFYNMKLSVIDDLISPGEIRLLRLAPLAWITSDHLTRFERMPTEYGPVDLRFQLSEDRKTLTVDWEPTYHTQPQQVSLHVPPIEGLEAVVVNGQRYPAKPGDVLKL